ncbi:MAG: 2-phosphosulfolactate phosphatase [Paenibacillus sp.]|nr:2-phosphosulfolactate phosphatase [Paenibacillus sp.]
MRVDVIPTVNEARVDGLFQKTVIVIDVLRATSTIVTALAHHCSSVIPVETVNQALQLQQPGDLLGGERQCKKIAGFHYGNSPLEYTAADISGKRIVMTTTNGTRAIQKCQRAFRTLAGSLLNAEACAKAAFSLRRDVAIVCSGTRDEFCLEDGLCAGLLLCYLRQLNEEPVATNDFGIAMQLAYERSAGRLTETLLDSDSGQRLCKLGLEEDVHFCAQLNRFELVPVWKEPEMIRF